MRLSELAEHVGGTLFGEDREITDARPLYEAGVGCITLVTDFSKMPQVAVAAVLLPLEEEKNAQWETGMFSAIRVENPQVAFAKIVALFHPPLARWTGIHPTAILGENVQIGQNVAIHANVCLMDHVKIGDGCTLFPNVTVYEHCELGARCILHAGAVVGAYGFGYDSTSGEHRLAPQLGNVVLEDDVELGANTTVDRGTFGSTRIGRGTKIDNLVMIGHNCQIGQYNLICSQVGIAGSTCTGDHVVMAGQVGVADHVSIANDVILGAQAGVPGNIREAGTYLGAPATPISEMKKQFVAVKQLGTYWRTLKKLAKDAEQKK